jgi:protoporphyrinogen oxidase
MKIGIIGGGFTGLTAAYYLQKAGHDVTVFERSRYLGGLAGGIKQSLDNPPENWEWDLEQYYHHWFTNDDEVFELGKELGVSDKFIITRPSTDILYDDKVYPLDSPLALLKFPHLPFAERVKTGITLARLKYQYNLENSKVFETITADEYLQKHSSKKAYEMIWKPLLVGKFADHYTQVTMRWFWARVYKRTPKLAYYEGGFSAFIKAIAEGLVKQGGNIITSTPIEVIDQGNGNDTFKIGYSENRSDQAEVFDKIIVTTPPHIFSNLFPNLPTEYKNSLIQAEGIGALVVILRLKHKLMQNTYWLSVNNTDWPFLAVVEHTNFMPKEKYGNETVVYIGDYLDPSHPNMSKTKQELLSDFTPYIKKINPLFSQESIIESYLFKSNYAQPIPKLNHESSILPHTTPIKGLYFASMAQVYPWDRGTNYAIEMGKNVAKLIQG